MSAEDTTAPDPRYVYYAGRLMLRVAGGDGSEDEDTPDEGAPDESEGTRAEEQEIDWESEGPKWQKRHQDLEPEFTRKSQRLAEIETALDDPEQLRELLRQRGYVFDEDEPEDDIDDEDTPEYRDPRVDDLLQEREQERIDRFVEGVADHIDSLAEEAGVELTDRQHRYILNDALHDGLQKASPERTVESFQGWLEERGTPETGGVKTKAVKPPKGRSASKRIDMSNDQEVKDALVREIEAASED